MACFIFIFKSIFVYIVYIYNIANCMCLKYLLLLNINFFIMQKIENYTEYMLKCKLKTI